MSFEDDKAAGNVANPAANSRSSEDSSFVADSKRKINPISALPAY
jgi:hypothetical protein